MPWPLEILRIALAIFAVSQKDVSWPIATASALAVVSCQ